MNSGYYITSTGRKVILESDETIYVCSMNIIELVIPDGAKEVDCSYNKLTKLICPDSVEYIDCVENYLTELIIPDDCIVECDPHVKVITRTMYNRSNRLKQILNNRSNRLKQILK